MTIIIGHVITNGAIFYYEVPFYLFILYFWVINYELYLDITQLLLYDYSVSSPAYFLFNNGKTIFTNHFIYLSLFLSYWLWAFPWYYSHYSSITIFPYLRTCFSITNRFFLLNGYILLWRPTLLICLYFWVVNCELYLDIPLLLLYDYSISLLFNNGQIFFFFLLMGYILLSGPILVIYFYLWAINCELYLDITLIILLLQYFLTCGLSFQYWTFFNFLFISRHFLNFFFNSEHFFYFLLFSEHHFFTFFSSELFFLLFFSTVNIFYLLSCI